MLDMEKIKGGAGYAIRITRNDAPASWSYIGMAARRLFFMDSTPNQIQGRKGDVLNVLREAATQACSDACELNVPSISEPVLKELATLTAQVQA